VGEAVELRDDDPGRDACLDAGYRLLELRPAHVAAGHVQLLEHLADLVTARTGESEAPLLLVARRDERLARPAAHVGRR
jgi:hypothetical protein